MLGIGGNGLRNAWMSPRATQRFAYRRRLCCKNSQASGTSWTPFDGRRHYLSQTVDLDGHALDNLEQRRRNKAAAKKFFRKLLKGLTYVPRVIVTNQFRSFSAAKRKMLPSVEHRQHRYLINRYALDVPDVASVFPDGAVARKSSDPRDIQDRHACPTRRILERCACFVLRL